MPHSDVIDWWWFSALATMTMSSRSGSPCCEQCSSIYICPQRVAWLVRWLDSSPHSLRECCLAVFGFTFASIILICCTVNKLVISDTYASLAFHSVCAHTLKMAICVYAATFGKNLPRYHDSYPLPNTEAGNPRHVNRLQVLLDLWHQGRISQYTCTWKWPR